MGHSHGKKHDEKSSEEPVEDVEAKKEEVPVEAAIISISEDELNKIKEEGADYKDKYLRLLAEGDNMRKRLLKEKQEIIQYSVQNVLSEFLPPLDHFENALKYTQNMSDEVKHWALGFQMILNQFREGLANNGVTAFQSLETQFDPHHHEAIEMVETTDHPEGIIVEETVKGYKMGGRTIRPARVKVAKAPAKDIKENKKEETEGV